MSDVALSSDQSDTPKTDAVAQQAQYWPSFAEVVPVHFARAQERRIEKLQSAIQAITCRLDMRFTRCDIERLEALLK